MESLIWLIGPRASKTCVSNLKGQIVEPIWHRFPDGEAAVEIPSEIWGRSLIWIDSLFPHPTESLWELGLIADTLCRQGCQVTAVIPYLAFMRQDTSCHPGHSLGAKVAANWISQLGLSRIVTVDPHINQVEGFFSIPLTVTTAQPLLQAAVLEKDLHQPVVVAPDLGRTKEASEAARSMKAGFAAVSKTRGPQGVIADKLLGSVRGSDVVIFDDILSTGATLAQAAQICREQGARRIFACVTHGLGVGNVRQQLENAHLDHLWMTDTVPFNPIFANATIVSIAPLLHATLSIL